MSNNTIWFQVPSDWVDALTAGDETLLPESARKYKDAFRQFMFNFIQNGTILSVGQSPYFSTQHDVRPYGVLPCDVVDMKVSYPYDLI